jgi:glycosyltransferase involved in cell wall biosynthesis
VTKRIAVLIPSYNEGKTIGGLVAVVRRLGLSAYVVDDGSSDDTAREAASHGAIVLSHEVNQGKGASLRDGFSRIVKDGYDYVLVMDGDGQHRPEDIDLLIRKMEETDAGMVVGNRMSDPRSMPRVRVIVNQFMSFLISVLSGQTIADTQCGFRLIKRDLLEGVALRSSHYETESEILIKAARKGWKIESVPITTVYQKETSRIRPVRDTMRFLALVARLVFCGKD